MINKPVDEAVFDTILEQAFKDAVQEEFAALEKEAKGRILRCLLSI